MDGGRSATDDSVDHNAKPGSMPRWTPKVAIDIASVSLGPSFSSVLDKYRKDYEVGVLIAWPR